MYNDKYELLKSAKEQFSEILPTFAYNLIVRPLEIEEYTDNQIILVVPQESQSNLIQNTYLLKFYLLLLFQLLCHLKHLHF